MRGEKIAHNGKHVQPRTASMRTSQPIGSDQLRALRVNDFCRLYGIGRSGVYKLLKEGKLASVVIAGRRLIPRDAAEALLRETTTKSPRHATPGTACQRKPSP